MLGTTDRYTCMDNETATTNDVKVTELTSWQVHACCQLIQRDAQHEHVSFLQICCLSVQHLQRDVPTHSQVSKSTQCVGTAESS